MKNKEKKTAAIALIGPLPPPYGGMSVQAQKLVHRLELEGVSVDFFPSNPSLPTCLSFIEKVPGIRTFLRTIVFCCSLLGLRGVQVVHIFGASHLYFFLVVSPAIFIAKVFRKKVILNYRGGEASIFLKKWGALALPILRLADVLAVPSTFLQEVFSQDGYKIHSVLLPNLADVEFFKYRERKVLKPVLVVSRQLEALYNHKCIFKAFIRIKKKYPEAVLKVAGSGSEESVLRAFVRECHIADIEFLGSQTHEQLLEVYDQSDIMVNASNADNFPGCILEAFMSGIPVVTTAVGGIPYMVKDGETGVLVGQDDDEALAERVFRLIKNPAGAHQIAANARKYAEGYGWTEVRKKLFLLYGLDG